MTYGVTLGISGEVFYDAPGSARVVVDLVARGRRRPVLSVESLGSALRVALNDGQLIGLQGEIARYLEGERYDGA